MPVFVPDEIVTAAKLNLLNLTFVSDAEPNSRTFTNTSFLDLDALTGGSGTISAVTADVEVGTAGAVLVAFSGQIGNSTAGSSVLLSYRISGATTVAASDAWSAARQTEVTSNPSDTATRIRIHSGLNAGSHTIELQARVTPGNTGTILRVDLLAVALPEWS